jgi:antitoxin component of RelBE/YafQ-DinJ toxin-antitoxin module
MPKYKTLSLRLDDESRARLEAVARDMEVDMAVAIRLLIKREHDRITKREIRK